MGDLAYQEAAGHDRIRVEAKKDAGFVRSENEEKIPARGKIFTGSLKQAKIRTDWGGKLNSYLIRTRTSFASGGGPEFRSGAHHEALKP